MTRRRDERASVLRREDFPALRAFARGYLHEDLAATHGTATAARDAFLAEASPDERERFFEEGARLVAAMSARSLRETADELATLLGAAWTPRRRREIQTLFARSRHDVGE